MTFCSCIRGLGRRVYLSLFRGDEVSLPKFVLGDRMRGGGVEFSLVTLVGIIIVVAVASFAVGKGTHLGNGSEKGFLSRMGASVVETVHDMAGGTGLGTLALEMDLNVVSSSSTPNSSGTAVMPSWKGYPLGPAPGETIITPLRAPSAPLAVRNEEIVVSSPANVLPEKDVTARSVSVKPVSRASCDFSSSGTPQGPVVLSEIAWMGTPDDSQNEWMELENRSDKDISLDGWRIANKDGDFKIIFGKNHSIGPRKFFILERTDDTTLSGISADLIYSGSLANAGDSLKFFDAACGYVDAVDVVSGWPGGDNVKKYTLERDGKSFGWHTGNVVGGTPRVQNSSPVLVAVSNPASSLVASSSSVVFYPLGVSMEGDGSGIVESVSKDIHCGFTCAASYPAGSVVKFSAVPDGDSKFTEWAGACTGTGVCMVTMKGITSLIARFTLTAPRLSGPTAPPSEPSTFLPGSPSYIVISGVQTTGGSGQTTNDFVQLYNPTSNPLNLKGYRLVKRTKTSISDTLLKSWTTDTMILPGATYVWANTDYTTIAQAPDVTTSGSIADDNGVALRNGPNDTGTIIDAVAWGATQNVFIEGSAYPTNPTANQLLARKMAGGVPQDTDNNADDFQIQ